MRFAFQLTVMAVVAMAAPAMADSAADLLQRYQAADTAEKMIRVEIEQEWRGRGLDPARYPNSFDCQVQVSIDSFSPEELGSIDAYAKDHSVANRAASQKVIKQRNARVDMTALTTRQCAAVKGT